MKQLLLKYMNSGFTLKPFGEYDHWRYPISAESFLDTHRRVAMNSRGSWLGPNGTFTIKLL